MAIEHRQEAFGVGGITRLDDDIEDQPALAGGQVKLVSVLNLTTALDDDVGVRLEQTDQLLASRWRASHCTAATDHAPDASMFNRSSGFPRTSAAVPRPRKADCDVGLAG